MMFKTILTGIIALIAFTAKAQHPGYTPVADAAQFKKEFVAAAQKINTIKSDFVQEKELGMLSEKITSKGKFWFKKNNMVRMEYTQPSKFLLVINNDNLLLKDEQKTTKMSPKSNKLFQQINGIVIGCVQGSILNSRDFQTKIFESKSSYLLALVPSSKALKQFFSRIDVVVNKKDNTVNNIHMVEPSGDNTSIQFVNREINADVPNSLFAIN